MNRGPLLFLGVFGTMAVSFWGLVLRPYLQIGRQEAALIEATGEFYPAGRSGLAVQGAEVYRSLGCVECHTQQVRPRGFGSDFEWGWGIRRTVARDYLRDSPVLLGSQRMGPDLANIGSRQTNSIFHLVHLYDPTKTAPGSMMPRYPFLFEKRAIVAGRERSRESLPLDDASNFEILPRPEAIALTEYLLSLKSEIGLFEAPLPKKATNAPPAEASTNRVAAMISPGFAFSQ
jgi:cytochrome c oxidase cbb3-type subunit 2